MAKQPIHYPLRIKGPIIQILLIVGIAILYYGAGHLATKLLLLRAETVAFWPAAGIALVSLFTFGQKFWPGVALGAAWFNISDLPNHLWLNLISACGASLQAWLGASLLHQIKFSPKLENHRDVFNFLLLGVTISPIINATITSIGQYLAGVSPDIVNTWCVWWLGDAMGILLLAPVLFTWLKIPEFKRQIFWYTELLTWLTLLFNICWLVFCSRTRNAYARYPLEYLLFPFVVWAALRFGIRTTAIGNLIIACFSIWGLSRDSGPFLKLAKNLPQAIFSLQAFIIIISITALVLASIVQERKRAEESLRNNQTSLDNAQRLAQIGNWNLDLMDLQLHWSDEFYRILGLTPNSVIPDRETFLELVHPQDRETVRQSIVTALEQNTPYSLDYRLQLKNGQEKLVFEQVAVSKTHITGTLQDVTQQRQSEAALRASEERFVKAFEASPVGIALCSLPEGYFLDVNKSFLHLLGWQRQEIINHSWEQLPIWSSPEELTKFTQTLEAQKSIKNIELKICTKSGEKRDWLLSGEIIEITNNQCLLVMASDITERKQSEALLRAKETAEAANRSKSLFLANMSHELRTPLNAIIGYSELLKEEANEQQLDELASDLERINIAGQHLLSIISDILDFSKIEAGKLTLDIEEFALKPLVDQVLSTIQPLINKNSNTLEVKLISPIDKIEGDPTRVRQCLLNLLSNSAKFTKQGTITFIIDSENYRNQDWIVFQVIDTGIGMTPEQLNQIFDPFTQGDSGTTKKYGGTGLGLTITKRFCEMMGGEINAISEAGQGSTFTIRLPAKTALGGFLQKSWD